MEQGKEIYVGIVGAGIRGNLLGSAFSQTPNVHIVAIADKNLEVGKNLALKFGAKAYENHEAMLSEDERINTLLICTPDFAHLTVALDAANKGLNFLVEKPLAMVGSEANEILSAAKKSGAKAMVAFENRWNPVFKNLKSQIDAGEIGEVRYQNYSLNDSLFVPLEMLSWAKLSSPGWFLMPHSLDLALWISSSDVVEVFAYGSSGVCNSLGVDTLDAITALVRLEDGTHFTLESNWILPKGMPQVFDFNIKILGTNGAFDVSVSEPGFKKYTDKLHGVGVSHYEEAGKIKGMIFDMMLDFNKFISGSDIKVPDLARGTQITEIIESIHESVRTGRPVKMMPRVSP
jgi:predicted dehydrogenase